jgi:peptidoglycan/LPS O-acetylase OafA/YrhL
MFALFCLADAHSEKNSMSLGMLTLLFALFCAQLSFVPLVLWPIIGRGVAGYGAVSSGWALAILGIGTAVAVAGAIIYLATGNEPWLWAAAPACLGSSFLLFAIARLRKQREMP